MRPPRELVLEGLRLRPAGKSPAVDLVVGVAALAEQLLDVMADGLAALPAGAGDDLEAQGRLELQVARTAKPALAGALELLGQVVADLAAAGEPGVEDLVAELAADATQLEGQVADLAAAFPQLLEGLAAAAGPRRPAAGPQLEDLAAGGDQLEREHEAFKARIRAAEAEGEA